ncbi:glycosyltransferase family 4 protein [Maridesulfovibrio hydrothermalis]|uniref:Glycosyl transferase group 1 n=1 Tax=Maridesulfovibrio hydrothermalis AM13 = DSM 14728 TaxID=1121451 RepID=L0R910_9BACT|nr:glycosyltransferase family 4 protein [Maridesulfovibrio hydrothermalis]CCO23248.1 Glycosyl transferase group 1 [Maridesulfovibrio hydrothermalis AM13 = DSM 14728]
MKIAVIGGYGPSLINFRGSMLRAMKNAGHEVYGIAPLDSPDVEAKLAELGVNYIAAPIKRTGMNPLKDLKALWALLKILRKIKPDAVLSYTIKPVIYGSIAARLAGVKNIFSMITGLGYAFGQTSGKRAVLFTLVKNMYRTGLAFNKVVMFQNPDDRNLFVELGIISKNKPTVITNGSGVDLDHFSNSPAAKGKPVFLCISRLLKEKGVREFAWASINLKKKYPEADFRLVGPHDHGPDSISENLINQWRAGGLEYAGPVSDVRNELKNCSVYVLPSYREGTPRSVLEAMATGRAVVTTDTAGCKETVIEGWNGYMVPVKNIPALEEAMELFITQPELIQSMGAASLEYVTEKYDVNKVSATIMNAMEL